MPCGELGHGTGGGGPWEVCEFGNLSRASFEKANWVDWLRGLWLAGQERGGGGGLLWKLLGEGAAGLSC